MDTKERRIKKYSQINECLSSLIPHRYRDKKLTMFVVVLRWRLFFCFLSERKRRRDGHQSRENEPRLLYNIRVCVCVCALLLLLVSGE
jgi:hypothetical protein